VACANVTSLSMSKNAWCGLPPMRAKKRVANSTALKSLCLRPAANSATVMSCKSAMAYSITFGTKNKPRSLAGAFCMLASR
jgi:hypothetical protein